MERGRGTEVSLSDQPSVWRLQTLNSYENNAGESVELDIQENKGIGPQVGFVCRWLQQEGVWGGVG